MTPRPYLSWSSLDLFERSPKTWKEIYLYGRKNPTNSGREIGRMMAQALEDDEAAGDGMLDLAIASLPKFELMDREFRAKMPTGKGTHVELWCQPDTMRADMSAFKEYKTGQKRWTQNKVRKFGQVTFYATGIYLTKGRIPDDIELVQVMTEKDPDDASGRRLRATGEVFRHPTQRTVADVLDMMVRIKKAWASMGKVFDEEMF